MIRTRSILLPLISLALAGCAETSSAGMTGPRVPAAGTATAESRRPHTCVIQDGQLRSVEVRIDPSTGDTLALDGRPLREAYPPTVAHGYAAGADWFRDQRTFLVDRAFVSYGLPRTLTPEMLSASGTSLVPFTRHQGVVIFVEPYAARSRTVDLFYVLPGPGCVWQPFVHGHTLPRATQER